MGYAGFGGGSRNCEARGIPLGWTWRAGHMNDLVASRGLHTLSFVPGDGHGDPVDYIDLYKRIQAGGKSLHVWARLTMQTDAPRVASAQSILLYIDGNAKRGGTITSLVCQEHIIPLSPPDRGDCAIRPFLAEIAWIRLMMQDVGTHPPILRIIM